MAEVMTVQALRAAAISTGLMAGVYFAFSVFVMASLKALPDSTAVASMNSINRVIPKSGFMPLFFGSSLLALLLMFVDVGATSIWLSGAGVVYLLGMLACTVLFNVPLNNRLRDVTSENESQVWQHYVRCWTRWNHLRVICSLSACILYIIALK